MDLYVLSLVEPKRTTLLGAFETLPDAKAHAAGHPAADVEWCGPAESGLDDWWIGHGADAYFVIGLEHVLDRAA